MLPLDISVASLVLSDAVPPGSHIGELSLMLSKQFRIALNWATVMLLNWAFISSSVWPSLPNAVAGKESKISDVISLFGFRSHKFLP